MKRISIYDLDGTVICSLHRYKTITENGKTRIDLNYWRENEHRAYYDSLLPLSVQYRADIADKDCYVIIATARVLHNPDNNFIRDKLGMPNKIISRPTDSSESGAKLKVKGLAKILNLKQFARLEAVFYEDNIAYLRAVCDRFSNVRGVFISSNQGH